MDQFTESLLSRKPNTDAPPPLLTPAAQPPLPERTSRWASVFEMLACLSLAASGAGALMSIFGSTEAIRMAGLVMIVSGVVGCIQGFFVAFIVGVFTDIRWYLARIDATQQQR